MAGLVTLHAFCSAKGGVGKSTLAVACAKLLAADKTRKCVLIDADLTGTSLADGLDLCAPKTRTRDDGSLDLDAPPDVGFHSKDETRKLRRQRRFTKWTDVAPLPAYLNDILIHRHGERLDGLSEMRECPVSAAFWRHEHEDDVYYLPSSPLPRDVSIALGWLYHEKAFSWIQRMTWLFDAMREQVTDLTDIVVDLPPGLFGFAHEMLVLSSHVSRKVQLPAGYPEWHTTPNAWDARAYLVTSEDRNDLRVSAEYFTEHHLRIPRLVPLVNRRTLDFSDTQNVIREEIGDMGVAEKFDAVDEMPALRKVFVTGDLALTPDVRAFGDRVFGRSAS